MLIISHLVTNASLKYTNTQT